MNTSNDWIKTFWWDVVQGLLKEGVDTDHAISTANKVLAAFKAAFPEVSITMCPQIMEIK